MSKELEECKAQLHDAVPGMEESKKAPSGNTCLDQRECKDVYQLVFGINANLIIDSAGNPEGNPEIVPGNEQYAERQLKAGERMLMKVIQEKNNLHVPKTRLDVELKDVRAQLLDCVKENKRLRRGIYSKCLSEPLYSSA